MTKLPSWQIKLFYLILFLTPINLAKHFILPSSYVSGILVDYLIPTIYLTDILIIILLLPALLTYFKKASFKINLKLKTLKYSPILIFLFLLLPSVIFAFSPLPSAYKWFKLLELSLFALWIKKNIDLKKQFSNITSVLSASVLFQSILSLVQWFKQSSVLTYLPFGVQPYTQASPGIDKITWFTGAIKIPPLGTFPHPNVLAGFLAAILPLILYQLLSKNKKFQILNYLSFLLGTITLFLTFSLSGWLAFLLIGLPLTLLNRYKSIRPLKFIFTYLGVFLILFSFASKPSFLAPASSFTRRSQLAKIATKMIKDKPFFGVGLNNFTTNMESYGYVSATTRFLQPVHNIYLLIFSETGLIGFVGFIYLGFKTLKSSKTSNPILLLPIITLLFLGLFDHYPLTIHQGLLLFFTFLSFGRKSINSVKN